MEKFLIPESKNEVFHAFEQAISIIGNFRSKDILILTQTKKDMHLEGLANVLGKNRVNSLRNNEQILINDINLRLESLRTFNVSSDKNSIIIGLYPSKNMFDKLDISNANAVIAVPSIITPDIEEWIDTYNPTIFGETPKKLVKNL